MGLCGGARGASTVGRSSNSVPVTDRRILVTGGSSGIGMSLARALAGAGASVVITGRDAQRLAAVARSQPSIDAVVCDVTDDVHVQALHRQIIDSGGLDVLVNCAGVMHFVDVTTGYPVEHQLHEVDIDVAGPIRMVDAFLPELLQRPSAIINVSSGLAWVPYAKAPVYSGAKAFVHAWTIALREQLKDTSVRVVEVLPPVTDTPLAAGLNRSFRRMSPDHLVRAVMSGLHQGREEIAPGQSLGLKWLCRLAPGFIFGKLNEQVPR